MEQTTRRFPLIKNFCFIQGTVPVDSSLRLPYSDSSEEERKKLIHRITRTETGGCFLITGYRGVGKTCFVDGVTKDIKEKVKDKTVLTIKLNLAKSLDPLNLMHQIIRKIYGVVANKEENIKDKDLLEYIWKSYRRTILKIKYSSDFAEKEILSKAIKVHADAGFKAMILGFLSAKFNIGGSNEKASAKEDSRHIAEELSYLDYDERAAEADILKIAELLREKGRLTIVVLDEMDKLIEGPGEEEKEKNIEQIKNILSALKNVFSASGLLFLLVAGKDFYDLWIKDREKEDSIYESIFSYDFYLSKEWDIGGRILQKYVLRYDTDEAVKSDLEAFRNYLNFKARGILRKAIHEYNNFVELEDDIAYLKLSGQEVKKVEYYAGLQMILQSHLEDLINATVRTSIPARRMDRLKYIIFNRFIDEKMLKEEGFNKDELLQDLQSGFEEEHETLNKLLQPLLEVLEKNSWIEKSEDDRYRLTKGKEKEREIFDGPREVSTQRERVEVNQRTEAELLINEAERLISDAKKVKEGENITAANIEEIQMLLAGAKDKDPTNEKVRELFEEIKPYIP